MIYKQRILLLNGSPRTTESTSDIIANYLIEQFLKKQLDTNKIYLELAIKSNDQIIDMFNIINTSDSVILISPVYFDSLPYIVTRSFELISKYRYSKETTMPYFYTIVNCGLPEIINTKLAIEISKLFALKSNFKWRGGIGFSMGLTINQNASQKEIKLRKKIIMVLNSLSAIIIEKKVIPDDLIKLAGKPLIPIWFYRYLSNKYWKKLATKYKVEDSLDNKVYQ